MYIQEDQSVLSNILPASNHIDRIKLSILQLIHRYESLSCTDFKMRLITGDVSAMFALSSRKILIKAGKITHTILIIE